jgi:type IV secretory pathway protease TraF
MKTLCFIIWMLISMIFVFSLIGLVMFIPKDTWENRDSTPSTWYSIGVKLLNSVLEN